MPMSPICLLSAAVCLAAAPALADQVGEASVYHDRFDGRTTASGERFDQDRPTAAHRSLPLGTDVRVTNLETGQSTEVEINDRGPYVDRRIIDLSEEAAAQIGMDGGKAKVKIEVEEEEEEKEEKAE